MVTTLLTEDRTFPAPAGSWNIGPDDHARLVAAADAAAARLTNSRLVIATPLRFGRMLQQNGRSSRAAPGAGSPGSSGVFQR